MKTAISLPDHLFQKAEELAARLGVSRSKLYSDALRAYLEWRQEEAVRDALDAVHTDDHHRLHGGLKRGQAKVLEDSDW